MKEFCKLHAGAIRWKNDFFDDQRRVKQFAIFHAPVGAEINTELTRGS